MMRRDEVRSVWAERSSTDPDLLVAPTPDDLRARRFEQCVVGIKYCLAIEPVRKSNCRSHRPSVCDNDRTVRPMRVAEFGQRDRAR